MKTVYNIPISMLQEALEQMAELGCTHIHLLYLSDSELGFVPVFPNQPLELPLKKISLNKCDLSDLI